MTKNGSEQSSDYDQKWMPYSFSEYPTLLADITRAFVTALSISLVSYFIVGYGVYFGLVDIEHIFFPEVILNSCAWCAARYSDLQRYDGISGDVYFVCLLLSFIMIFISYYLYVSAYFANWCRHGTYKKINSDALGGFFIMLIALLFLVFFLLFMPVGLSELEYEGHAIIFSGAFFPLLVGSAMPLMGGFAGTMTVFIAKMILQRGRFKGV